MDKTLMRFISITVIIILISGCGGEPDIPAVDKHTYEIGKTDTAPVVDGMMNDACWKTAETKSLTLSENGKKPSYPSTVRAVYDSEYLYIGFECQDIDAASTIFGKDSPVAEQEHISVLIDAGVSSNTYAVIDIAPTGAVYDAFVLNYRDNEMKTILPEWDCDGLISAVSVYGEGAAPGTKDRFWIVELALPFKAFLTAANIPPLPNDIWRINFYRTELSNVQDISAFAPTGSDNVHIPSRFGRLIFEDSE
ncbi:carbohydrate-binding family 9-like protein [Candidatus Latescibacterota bacterium]